MNKVVFVFFTILLLSSAIIGKAYKGAEYRTKESYLYGRYQACYKPPVGTGMLATFFTYNDFSSTIADWNEIDIEILGRYENDIQFTTITPYQTIYDSHTYVGFNLTHDYHVYAFEWTPEYVAWFIDGLEYYRQTAEHINTLKIAQKIMLNIWATEYSSWTDLLNPDVLPLFAYYDWVSYASYTPGTGTTGTDNNFTPQWQDEFDSFDENRWEKSHNHTWNGNLVDMDQNNVIFQDGKLILALTDQQNTGFVDNNPPVILWARADSNKLTVRYSEDVDSSSALTLSKYSVPGLVLHNVNFLGDQRTVILETTEFDTTKSYSLVVFGISDNSPNYNTNSYALKSIIITKTPSFPLRINVGGGALYNDKYLPDQVWAPEVDYGHMDGLNESYGDLNEIAGTEEDSLYLVGLSKIVKYKIRVPDGIYDVAMHFSENTYETVGSRIFDIYVEDSKIVDALDLFSVAGKNHAYDIKAENITVDDGIIDIHFSNWTGHPILCGLTVVRKSNILNLSDPKIPMGIKLFQNYPNPFNPDTNISFEIPKKSRVKLEVFNTMGQIVKTLFNGYKSTGHYEFIFNAKNLSTGLYFYRLTTNNTTDIKKMLLIE